MPKTKNKLLNGFSFKKLVFPLLILAVILVIFFKLSELRKIGQLIAHAKWYWLVAALGCQVLNFILQGSVYNVVFKILRFGKVTFNLVKARVVLIFLNYTIPSAGLAGNVWLFQQLRKRGIKEGSALMSVVMEFMCYYAAFVILLVASLFYLFFVLGRVGRVQIFAAIGFGLVVCLLVFFIYFFIGNKGRAKKRISWLAQKIDRAEDGIRDEKRVKILIDDFYRDLGWLKKNKRVIVKPLSLQVATFLADGTTVFLIFLAFGAYTPIGLGLVAFVFGRLAGLISFIPGGVGAFESSMVLIFNALGVNLELALSVMLVYRLLSYWLYFPLGLTFYRQFSKEQ